VCELGIEGSAARGDTKRATAGGHAGAQYANAGGHAGAQYADTGRYAVTRCRTGGAS
jgi:hypothetical protein